MLKKGMKSLEKNKYKVERRLRAIERAKLLKMREEEMNKVNPEEEEKERQLTEWYNKVQAKLKVACSTSDLQAVKWCLQQDCCDINCTKPPDLTLVKNSVHRKDYFARLGSSVHIAACFNKPLVFEILLHHKADLEIKNSYGWTPLMVALREKSVDVLDFMTGNEEEEKNANTFHSIIRNDDLEAVRTLLDGKADPNCKTRNKDSACHVTVQKDSNARREILVELLWRKADVDAKDNKGRTPLHRSCIWHNTRQAVVLLEYDADPMACDQMKDTPLHLCAENNNVEIAKLLLEAKSDVTLKNTNGRRPVDVAKLFQMRDVQGYLRRQEKTSPFFAV